MRSLIVKTYNMKKLIVSICLLIGTTIVGFGQNGNSSYNYNRGFDALENNNYEEAFRYFADVDEKAKEYPYAQVWIAVLYKEYENYSNALSAVNVALKKMPKKDKTYTAFAYSVRAKIFENVQDYERALLDYTSAIKAKPSSGNYEDRGDFFYNMKLYDYADMDYKKMIEIDESDLMGYMKVGRNHLEREQYEDAKKYFDYVIKMNADYSSGYSFRADCLYNLKRYSEATDDVIKALDIDGNSKAYYILQLIADSAFQIVSTKLKIQQSKNPNEASWNYYLGVVYENANKYAYAISYYRESHQQSANSTAVKRIAICYDELGNYDQALTYINTAIDLDSTDYSLIYWKSNIEFDKGMSKEAIKDIGKYIEKYPDYYYGYYKRGWYEFNTEKDEAAIEDFTTSIILDSTYAHSYLCRGDIYKRQGKMDLARKDFEKITEIDTLTEQGYQCVFYAYLELGQKDMAFNTMQKNLSLFDDYYNAACLYSLAGEPKQAISYLRTAMENGYRCFAHIEEDSDLNNIRQLPEFKQLIKEYKSIVAKEISEASEIEGEYVEKTAEIPFTKTHGVCEVKCTINGMPLYFVFDTGASDITMSSVEANFMLKNRYLTEQDIVGKQYYQVADGGISEGTVINIRNVNFGGLDLNNIKASVVKSQQAPLLLGQSALQKLGKIEIDNEKRVIKITYKEKK